MGKHDLLHNDLTYRIVGCAPKVHRTLGPGFPENICQKALSHELLKEKLLFEGEKPVEVYYDGVLCGQFRLDLLVDKNAVVELKALDSLCDEHLAQTITYLKATDLKVALLLNFGCKSLEVRRVVL